MYLEKISLNGQVAGVTGGDRNFGLQSACTLGEAGARPVITDIDDAAGQPAVARLAERQIQAEYLAMDETDSAQVNAVADQEVASLVLLLVSDLSSMIQGCLLVADNGYTADGSRTARSQP